VNQPTISVILAVHNGQQFVGQAIESILNQTYDDLEFIIVDDASTDSTPAILESFQKSDPRVTILRNSQNMERSASRNRAIREAQGHYPTVWKLS
jgi:glycosyltransferase involved in cell wall biosynthesis